MSKKPQSWYLLNASALLFALCLLTPNYNAQTLTTLECKAKNHKGRIVGAYQGSSHEPSSGDAEPLKQIVVLDHIESNIRKPQAISPPADIWLDLPQPIMSMNPIDCDVQYECTGASFYLTPIETSRMASVKNRLKELSELPLFGCYRVENDFENKQEQTRCRYIRRLSFNEKQFKDEAANEIGNLLTKLKGEKITDIWFEAGVRVDSTGLPLEKLCAVRPVLITTDRNSYLLTEEVNASAEFAQQIIVTGKRVFSFIDTSNLKPTIVKVMNTLSDELEKDFSADPLLAGRTWDAPQGTGEWIFKRERQKSSVIGRASWLPAFFNSAYEISTYTFKWFSSDQKEMTSSVEHGFFGKGAERTFGHNIFIQVDQVLLIASGPNERFNETIDPKSQMDNYLSLYKKAVSDAFLKALRDTCYNRLAGKGVLTNGVCEIRGDVQ